VSDLAQLERDVEEILAVARWYGLDHFEMRFEICPPEMLYSFGAYGMPSRFAHWSFGKAFQRIKMEHDHQLSRIYEMVINTDPCYAFLLRNNTRVQNRLVAAHVLAHSDFFKHNIHFAGTPRNMLETMAASARRIRDYERVYGREQVEGFLDAVLAIQEHVDPHGYRFAVRERGPGGPEPAAGAGVQAPLLPDKDLLGFILRHGRGLADWQRDVIAIVRDEALYFWPQFATKICNEGWATYWHLKIMRSLDLNEAETIEFARMHAELIQPARTHVNPYLLGLRVFMDIEQRFGEEAVFEVRTACDDVSFLRSYLTAELVQELGLYVFRRIGYEWRVGERDWRAVRDTLIQNLFNCGHPYIMVENGDFHRQGELYLKHYYEGVELDVPYLEKTLPLVHRLWGRPVHLETVLDDKAVVFSFYGGKVSKRFL
jgi:stage V sporulation protein R